jgi:hypothetical protein
MNRRIFLLLAVMLTALLILAGCDSNPSSESRPATGSESAPTSRPAGELDSADQNQTAAANALPTAGASAVADESTEAGTAPGLVASGDLSLQTLLALGTLRLEETELAVDEDQARSLLPLWQALQSLSASDTTAPAELEAVVRQLEGTMSAAQINAIQEMGLTAESLAEMVESGALGLRAGNRGGNGTGAGGAGEGGLPGGGFPGGGPGAGGGPGGGAGFPGGGPGAAGVEMDEDALATRQAQRESGAFQEQALLFSVVRLLQNKTGEMPVGGGNIATVVFEVVAAETGLDLADIQEQVAAGSTLVAIIEASGAEVAGVRTALIASLGQLDNAPELDLEAIADRWLGPAE